MNGLKEIKMGRSSAQVEALMKKIGLPQYILKVLWLLTLICLWAGQTVRAQAIGLPLSSVGREVGWFSRNGGDDYHLAVFERAANQPLLLELYSPEVNLNDYARQRDIANYYGDEIYGKNIAMRTDFALLNRDGSSLAGRSFGNGEQHAFDLLYSGTLAAGFYPLQVNTYGNGKNAFGFRTPPGVAVEASQFTVVTRGQLGRDQLAARLTLNASAVGKEFRLENFDADGAREMAIFALLPGNKRVRLNSSEDVGWAANVFRVTPEMVGEWAILVRILPSTRQFSNSVTFRMRLDDQPYFARMPSFEGYSPKGILEVEAVAQFCGQSMALAGAEFSVAGANHKTPRALTLTAGNYLVQGAVLTGSETPAVNATIRDGQTTQVKLVYSVLPALHIEPEQLKLQEGQSAEVKAIVRSAFPYALGYRLELASSDLITLTPGAPLQGMVSAEKAVEIPLGIRANQAGRTALRATLVGCADAQMPIEVEPIPVIPVEPPPPAVEPPPPAVEPPPPAVEPPPPPVRNPEVDLVLLKTVNLNQVSLDQPVIYTLTVSNHGPDRATQVMLSDAFPPGLKIDWASGNPNIAEGRITWELGTLAKGEGKTLSVQATALREGRWINSARVEAKEVELDLSSNSATAALEVLAPPPPPKFDLVLSKNVNPSQAVVGQTVSYTLTVGNNGPDAAAEVVLVDSLPAGLKLLSSTPVAEAADGKLIWNLGTLTKGERRVIKVVVLAEVEGHLLNSAWVKSGEGETNLPNNRADAPLQVDAPPKPKVDIAVGQAISAASLIQGEAVTYTLTATNHGPDTATNVTLHDMLPAGLDYSDSSPEATPQGRTLIWNLGTLATGESKTVLVHANAREAGRWINSVSVKADQDDPMLLNNQARAELVVESPPKPQADVALSQTVSAARVTQGERLAYTLRVVNHGPDTATNVTLHDGLPAGLGYGDSSPKATLEGNSLSWNLGSLAPGEQRTFSIVATAKEVGRWVNGARVKASEDDPTLVNNQAEVGIEVVVLKRPQVDLVVSKSISADKVTLDTHVSYTLSVSNNGPDTASGVVLIDYLPEGLSYVSASSSPTISGNTLSWKLGLLHPGESKAITLQVRATAIGDWLNIATAGAQEDQLNLINNRAEAGLQVIAPPPVPRKPQIDLALSKTVSPAQVAVGERATYTLTVVNHGPDEASDVTLSDQLPAGLKLLASEAQASAEGLYWELGNLAQGQSRSVSVEVLALAVGTLVNTASVKASQEESSTGNNNTASAALLVVPPPPPAELPLQERESQVLVVARLSHFPRGVLILCDKIPANSSYITSSSLRIGNPPQQPELSGELKGQAIPDPLQIGDRLYWLLPADKNTGLSEEAYGVVYRLAHRGALQMPADRVGVVALLPQGAGAAGLAELRLIQGNPEMLSDLLAKVNEVAFFATAPDQGPWIINGAAGVQVNAPLGGSVPFSIGLSSQAFARGPVLGDAMLTLAYHVAYDSALGNFTATNLMPPANPYERFPLLGDSARLGSDVHSFDAFYLKLEKGDDYLLYGQLWPGFRGLLSSYNPQLNGIQGVLQEGPFGLWVFASPTPNANLREFFRGDGTSFYKLRGSASTLSSPTLASAGSPAVGVKESSEQVKIIVYDRFNPGLKISQQELRRLADYDVDYSGGRILLSKPLGVFDANGNPQFLEVAYALADASKSDWLAGGLRYGAQLGARLDGFSIGATYLRFDPAHEAYIGARAGFELGALQVGAELGFSGSGGQGIMATAAQASYDGEQFQFGLRYQDRGLNYVEPSTGLVAPGRDLAAEASFKITGSLNLNANYSLRDNLGLATQTASLEAKNDFGGIKAALGAALEVGALNQTWLTAGIEVPLGNFTIGALQKIGLGSTNGETVLSLDYALSRQFGLRLSDTLVFANGFSQINQRANLGLRGSFSNAELLRTLLGNEPETPLLGKEPETPLLGKEPETPEASGSTNIAASYDLPSADGQAGQARVGLETELPLSANLSAHLGGEYIAAAQSEANLNLGLSYRATASKASARAQFSLLPTGLKRVFTAAGLFQLWPDLVFSPAAEYTLLPGGDSGGKFSLAAAYRGDDLSLLTNNRLKLGKLYTAANSELDGELRLAYEAGEVWFLRAGVAYKLSDGLFTGQVGTGATWYLLNNLGLEAGASYLFSGNTTSSLLFGIGANLRFAPGLALGAGFNFETFAVGVTNYLDARPGLYLRLDWKFDERSFGR